MTEIRVVPRIRYPKDACVGLTYLVTVDLDHGVPPEAWPYAEEEYPVTCFIDAGSLFEHEPVGDRTIVVHRFGGSYGPAIFRLRAHTAAKGTLRIILVDRTGAPIAVVPLDEIEVRNTAQPLVRADERILDLEHPALRTGQSESATGEGQVTPEHAIPGRALLVGAAAQLRGVEPDIRAMTEMLVQRGFQVDVCTGAEATRQGILERYNALIASIQSKEAAVFYYSGHAWYSFDQSASRYLQGIIPTDFSESTDSDFRGITAWELAILEAQLTRRTRNVTVILDCSHASQMSRGGAIRDVDDAVPIAGAVSRALPHPDRQGFAAHLRALRARYGAALDAVDPIGNCDVVRLVACMPEEDAYEYVGVDGQSHGAFTKALLDILQEVGNAPVSWASIDGVIRERVREGHLRQRTDIEGPARRRLFSLMEEAPGHAVSVARVDDGFRIEAGRLMGVTLGDVYGVSPLGAMTHRGTSSIVEVRVRETSSTSAMASAVGWKNGDPEAPPNAIAFLLAKAAPRRAVRIEVPEAMRQAVNAELLATQTLRAAEPDEPTALPTLRLADGALTIDDDFGSLFPAGQYPGALRSCVENLANLAKALELRELEGDHGVAETDVEIEWGAVDHGEMRPLPERGSSLGLGDRIYVKVKSKARRGLYAHVFSIGARGKITLLTGFAPSGVALTDHEPEFVLGRRSDGPLLGLAVSGPSELPHAASSRTEELAVIVTTARASLRSLETVELVINSREIEDAEHAEDVDAFYLKRLSYFPRPRDEAVAFAVDDEPLRPDPAWARDVGTRADEDRAAPDDRSRTDTDFGVVIGIEHYPRYRSLFGAANDAQAFRDWLCDPQGGGLPQNNVMLILSSADTMGPSQDDIDEALFRLLRAADAIGGGRRFYFYFSGHGATEVGSSGRDIALLLTRWSKSSPRLALSAERYASELCGAGLFEEVVMFVDCCRVFSDPPIIGMGSTITATWNTAQQSTRSFLAYASEPGQRAFESKESDAWQGLFTRSLLSVLRGGSGISADALKERLERALDDAGRVRGVSQRAQVANGLDSDSRFGVGSMLP